MASTTAPSVTTMKKHEKWLCLGMMVENTKMWSLTFKWHTKSIRLCEILECYHWCVCVRVCEQKWVDIQTQLAPYANDQLDSFCLGNQRSKTCDLYTQSGRCIALIELEFNPIEMWTIQRFYLIFHHTLRPIEQSINFSLSLALSLLYNPPVLDCVTAACICVACMLRLWTVARFDSQLIFNETLSKWTTHKLPNATM